MFELADFKKGPPDYRPITKSGPIVSEGVQSYGAVDEVEYGYSRSKFEDGEVLSYFTTRRVSKNWVQYWMFLQVGLLLLQVMLFAEVSVHSSTYYSAVHESCNGNEEVQGSCKSRLWQRRVDEEYRFDGGSKSRIRFDDAISHKFTTSEWMADSVQVSVIADPATLHVPYEIVLTRKAVEDFSIPEKSFYEYRTTGVQPVVISQDFHTKTKKLFSHPVDWEMSIHIGKYVSPSGQVGSRYHGSSYGSMLKGVRVIVNEMIGPEKNVLKEKAPMCDIEKSWNSIMMTSLSLGSGRLSWIKKLLAVSIMASISVTFLLWAWYSGRRLFGEEGVNQNKFHYLVFAKTVCQDLPLQAIVLWYICSWYEGGGGERCQLCLLDLKHCEKMSPFHMSNFFMVLLVLVSAISNQFLFQADPGKIKTEDDQFFVSIVRVMMCCVMILPFSTAMVAFNGTLIQVPALFHSLFLVPCFAGWVALFSLMCFPLTAILDDHNDQFFPY